MSAFLLVCRRFSTATAFVAAFAFTWISGAQPASGTSLRFTGTNDYVSVPHSPALNAFPLTITAWIKTARVTNLVDGVITKYFDASFNGYSLNIRNGNLYAWYLRGGANGVLSNPFGVDGGFIADGQWHHIAFVISPVSGSIYVDGNLRVTVGWTGVPGPPTGTEPLQFGRYHNYPNSFEGELDEVTLWNRALTSGEVNYLKHRVLQGSEDGLVGCWRADETAGSAVNNSATNSHHGVALNGVSRPPSYAALALRTIATNAIRFNGVSGFVQVPHSAALNSYPLTAQAWFRTTNATPVFVGVLSKYADATGNGWAIGIQSGRVRAFYYRTPADSALDVHTAPSVADGGWHHVALVVDPPGGRIYLDGILVGSSAWAGTPGATTSTQPFQIGRYDISAIHFTGAIDEVAIWSRALSASEIQLGRNRPLVGNEAGLAACWHMDEGAGTTTVDASANLHHATLVNSPAWVGSTAYLGDGSTHLIASPGVPTFARQFAISTAPSQNAFTVNARGLIRRFHDFASAPADQLVTNRLQAALRVAGTGAPIEIQPASSAVGALMPAYNASAPQPLSAGVLAQSSVMSLLPQPGVQLDSVNLLYEAVVTLSHNANGSAFVVDGSDTTQPTRLLHFNGHLMHGPVDSIFTNLAVPPSLAAAFPPTHQRLSIQISANGGYLVLAPAVRFGGPAFLVDLGVNGTATNVSGAFNLASAEQFFETAGVRYRLPGLQLHSGGATAGRIEAWFPTGFGMQTTTNSRVHFPFATRTNIVLTGSLVPTVASIFFTAASYNTDLLWFSEETKPLLFGATQVEWRIPQGEFHVAQAESVQFVRQQEDRQLSDLRGVLVEPLAGDRVSNDGYYRNAVAVPGAPLLVRPGPHGAALVTLQVDLQENEYRPHFPYLNRNIAGHLPMIDGALVVTNDLIDTASSYVLLAGPAPIPYARDCSPEAGCSVFPTIGLQVLNFTGPPGHFGLPEFTFTQDGGLLAYGSIPPTNLTWGFIGSATYAQRTSDVQQGAYHIAGTFLRGDQTVLPAVQRPGALLFSGWGNATNRNYVERPGTPAYASGFGNYAGLNFRAPAQGRSFIAGQDTGSYPLTPRSKYYARFGGVSGIHESATFPSTMTLYGYAFSFTSYRLSYLDSENWESRTDGVISLPHPSNFPVEFERMKFLCRGNLDSARLPANIPAKQMVYWNTAIKPLSLQFKPRAGNACSLTERYLVLGVETKLPFIPQAFHTALGFKNNGNLTTLATGVEGVDSRFPVPAQLHLQGPGGSTYPLTTAAAGYFNNWETSGRPEAGFYSLVGRIRVPFFRDTKVHLHVTPTSPTNSQISIMGGWPSEEGITANRGWRSGTQDYFNTPGFDPQHDAWPGGAVAAYRNSPDESFRPRAQRNWIDVALFDYPLTWNPVLRQFSSFVDSPVVLPVIDVDSRLKELTPGKVDLDFAQDLNLQLPRIKVLDFANDALNELNGPLNSVSNAIRAQLGSALNTAGLTSGFRSLQNALRENSEGFFRPVLEPALDPVVNSLYNALSAELAVSKANLLAKAPAIVTASSNGLQNAVRDLNGTIGQANSIFGQLNRTLQDADDTLGLFIRVLEKDSGGKRHVVRAIIQKLAADQGPVLGFAAGLADSLVNGLLSDLEPTLAKVEGELRQLRNEFNQVRMQVGGLAADNDFAEALNRANHTAATLGSYTQLAAATLSNHLAAVVGPAGDYFIADPARARREIRERLVVAFLSSQVSSDYQTTLRQFLYDKNFLLDQLMDVLFDQVNRSIRDGLSSQIAGATDGLFQNMKGGGLLSGSLLSAKIRGAPTFEGDSLRKIHLDSEIEMNMPDSMKFMAYMDIKELNSQSTALSCIPSGAPAAEVTLGAKDIPLDWLGVSGGTPLTLSIEARWTLQSGAVLGVGGSLEVKGKVGFKGVSLNDFGASLAIGQLENYFAAKAGATVVILGIPVDFTAGIFAGKSCSIDPLVFIDPEAPKVLIVAISDFSGIYLQFGGGLSLSEILFGTSSCLLDIGANVTSALYYQGGPALGSIGGRQKITVNVDLICIISASAEWATAFRLDSIGRLTLQGEARLCGKIGWCPVCLKACKSLTVTGTIGDGGIDYEVDF